MRFFICQQFFEIILFFSFLGTLVLDKLFFLIYNYIDFDIILPNLLSKRQRKGANRGYQLKIKRIHKKISSRRQKILQGRMRLRLYGSALFSSARIGSRITLRSLLGKSRSSDTVHRAYLPSFLGTYLLDIRSFGIDPLHRRYLQHTQDNRRSTYHAFCRLLHRTCRILCR